MVQVPGKDGFSSAAQAARHVIIVGGGASGVLLAAHLLRNEGNTRVTIVERRALLGCGVAYSTADPGHLLNTRVSNMSAWPDQPEHFLNWVRVTHDPDVCPFSFVSRGLYGEYMAGLLDPWRNSDMLNCARQDCLRIEESDGGGVIAHLADGTRLVGDIAVLATGHLLPDTTSTQALTQPWAAAADGTPEDRVLIVGSGLTMIDQVVSLRAQGHRGAISVLSRRGLLPQVHEPTTPVRFTQDTLPLGAGAAATMHWIRAAVRARFAAGGNWRDVVDGLRPHVQSLWRASPEKTRAILAGKNALWGYPLAALLGVATPFCSCSSVPLFIGFVSAGIPLGVTFSFLIAGPMVGPVGLGLLYGLVGWRIATIYLALGFTIATVAGFILGRMRLERYLQDWVRELNTGAIGALPEQRLTLVDRLKMGFEQVREIVGKVWIWVLVGIGIGAMIHGYVPEAVMLRIMGGEAWWSVPAAVVIGVPMYTNAAGVIPIVEALLGKGAALGTTLAFMMSVIALSLPEMIILKQVLTLRLIAIFVAVVSAGILATGYLFNFLL